MAFERITINPDGMDGLPVIRGLRMPVATVVAMIADGMSVAEILDDFPDVEAEGITQAIRYRAPISQRGPARSVPPTLDA